MSYLRLAITRFNTGRECGISRGAAMSWDFFVRQGKALEVVARALRREHFDAA